MPAQRKGLHGGERLDYDDQAAGQGGGVDLGGRRIIKK
jgi:hypothetical protein